MPRKAKPVYTAIAALSTAMRITIAVIEPSPPDLKIKHNKILGNIVAVNISFSQFTILPLIALTGCCSAYAPKRANL
jgi:hypothetical protein